tara:strand:- start:1636 stop:1827 length:192 start_codon:yes stop_codon:yes gene_type:complete
MTAACNNHPEDSHGLEEDDELLVDLKAWLLFSFKLDDDLIALVKKVKDKESKHEDGDGTLTLK